MDLCLKKTYDQAKRQSFRSERVGLPYKCQPRRIFFQRGTAALLESVRDKMFILNSFHTFPEEMCQVLHEAIGIFLKSSYIYKI